MSSLDWVEFVLDSQEIFMAFVAPYVVMGMGWAFVLGLSYLLLSVFWRRSPIQRVTIVSKDEETIDA